MTDKMFFEFIKEHYLIENIEQIKLFCNILLFVIIFWFILQGVFVLFDLIFDKKGKKEVEAYSKALDNLETKSESQKEDGEKTLAVLERMKLNLREINEYYVWSKKQTKQSFYLSVIMGFIGMIFLGYAIFQSKIESALIPAIAGAIIEFIAGTALIVYRYSLSQLNYYYKSLHENERFLSSINLIDKFKIEDLSDELLRKIIESEIQMNLTEAEISSLKDSNSNSKNIK